MHLEELTERASRTLSQWRRAYGQEIAQPMEGLLLLQQDAPSALEATLYEPVLCLILQGEKEVRLGEQRLAFGPGECLIVSHDVPVRSRITRAPYLALVFQVDVAAVRRLYEEVADATLAHAPSVAAVTQRADAGLLDALCRYLALAGAPAHAKVLGPLVAKEIHYRLLVAPSGGMLRSLVRHDSHASAIARAIAHIRGDIRAPIAIPDLARRVGMSASSFHAHFKAITSTTPLQYQKELRLIEARRLLKTAGASVTTTAYEVGYESASQFSREYARKFGAPPSEDAAIGTGPAEGATARKRRTLRRRTTPGSGRDRPSFRSG